VVVVNDENFEAEVVRSAVPVLIDFSAVWCQPCRAVAPLVDQLAEQYAGRVKVAKLDIDQAPRTASKFAIRGVPTLLLVKGGVEVSRMVGAAPKARIAELMDKAL